MKKIVSMLLAVVFMFSLGTTALAAETFPDIIVCDNGDTIIDDGKDIYRLTVYEDDVERSVTIKNESNGDENTITYNKLKNTIYSSITGNTTTLDLIKGSNISTFSESSYKTHYLSYSDIRTAVGDTATVAGLIGFIMAAIPGADVVGGALSGLATIVGAGNLAVPNDPNHGLAVQVKTIKYYRVRNGHRGVYKVQHVITDISTY